MFAKSGVLLCNIEKTKSGPKQARSHYIMERQGPIYCSSSFKIEKLLARNTFLLQMELREKITALYIIESFF